MKGASKKEDRRSEWKTEPNEHTAFVQRCIKVDAMLHKCHVFAGNKRMDRFGIEDSLREAETE